jgi:enterochelin esterase-like enzyme
VNNVVAGLDVISGEFMISIWSVAGVLLIGTVLVVWRVRRHRFLLSSIASLVTIIALVTATAASFNAYYAYLPTVGDAAHAATGDRQWVRADRLAHLSTSTERRAVRAGLIVRASQPADPADGFAASTTVEYLPPQYFNQPTARFPVVYLFHGSPGQPADWFHAGDAQRAGRLVSQLGHPAILVAPRMSKDWTDDPECVNGVTEKVESHLIDQVIPRTDASLRTLTDRQDRVFAGMSAGGYCALNVGLRNRNLVGTIIDMSGDTMPTHTGGAAVLFGGKSNPGANQQVAANSPDVYAASLAATPPTRIWLDSGSEDTSIVKQNAALEPTLSTRGIDVQWRVRSGGHTYWVWTAALQEALPWALGGQPGKVRLTSHQGPTA